MSHAITDVKIENPGTLKSTSTLTTGFGICAVVGFIIFLVTLNSDPTRAWSSYLMGHFYFMGLAILAVFFVGIHWMMSAMWSTPVRRIAEGFTAYLPFVAISTIVLLIGLHTLYPWTHPEIVAGDPVLESKVSYLNVTAFIIRAAIAIALWIFFGRSMVKGSLALDDGAPYLGVFNKNKKLGTIFMIVFALSWTWICIDQLKSLDPRWFSTMFGVYQFGAYFQSIFALITLITLLLKWNGYLDRFVNENHLHDLGKYMFAFTVFWAYTAFAQFMLIWYANLPEETGYFLRRLTPGWYNFSVGLFLVKFVVPFLALLPRDNKRLEGLLFCAAAWILGSTFYELIWLVQPEFYPNGPVVGIPEIGTWLGFLGIFGLCFVQFMKRNSVLAYKDARLPEALDHHVF